MIDESVYSYALDYIPSFNYLIKLILHFDSYRNDEILILVPTETDHSHKKIDGGDAPEYKILYVLIYRFMRQNSKNDFEYHFKGIGLK